MSYSEVDFQRMRSLAYACETLLENMLPDTNDPIDIIRRRAIDEIEKLRDMIERVSND